MAVINAAMQIILIKGNAMPFRRTGDFSPHSRRTGRSGPHRRASGGTPYRRGDGAAPRKRVAAFTPRRSRFNKDQIVAELKRMGRPEVKASMESFGINTASALGISVPELRRLGTRVGMSHELALEMWDTGIHEARLLATIIEDPLTTTNRQMELWVRDLDAWDVCDSLCTNVLWQTKPAYMKAAEWSRRDREFVRRAGFAMMAVLASHDKEANDQQFINFFPLIGGGADDDRNFVKKAVSWALRNIGKRNMKLNKDAIAFAEKIALRETPSAKWIAMDVIRELKSDAVINRLKAAEAAAAEAQKA